MGFDAASVVGSVEDGYPQGGGSCRRAIRSSARRGTRTYLYRDVQNVSAVSSGKEYHGGYVRDRKSYTTQMVPRYSEEAGRYLIGISGGVYQKPASVIQTAQYSFYEVRYWIRVTFSSLGDSEAAGQLERYRGSVRIVSMIGTTVKKPELRTYDCACQSGQYVYSAQRQSGIS